MEDARDEARLVLFGAVEEALRKTGANIIFLFVYIIICIYKKIDKCIVLGRYSISSCLFLKIYIF